MKRILVTTLYSLLALLVLVAAPLEVHFIDVGQADSTLVLCEGQAMLIDAGNNADGTLVVHYLRSLGLTTLNIAVGTHPHEDHIGGLDDVLEAFTIEQLWMPNATHTTQSFFDLLETIERQNLKITVPKAGESFTLGGATLTIMAPQRSDYFDLNDHSLVIKLEYAGQSFLFTGDAESTSEWHMLASGLDLATDVLKVGHHGSTTSTNPTFISAVNPSIAVIHVGQNNPYGHPSPLVLKRLPEQLYRTDQDGTVIISVDADGRLRVETAREVPNPHYREVNFIGDRQTKRYHTFNCTLLPSAAHQVGIFDHEYAQAESYSTCPLCLP